MFQFFPNKKWCQKKRNTKKITAGNPEIGRQIGAMMDKNIHPLIGKKVKQTQSSHEQKTDSNNQEIIVVQITSGIPNNEKYCKRDSYANYFYERMKKKKTIKTSKIKQEQNQTNLDSSRIIVSETDLF